MTLFNNILQLLNNEDKKEDTFSRNVCFISSRDMLNAVVWFDDLAC